MPRRIAGFVIGWHAPNAHSTIRAVLAPFPSVAEDRMAAATSPAFVTLLRRQKLLEPAHLAEVEQSLAAQFPKAKTLAHELLQRGWLTAYQVNQIAQGHGADLRLGNYVI